VFAVSEVHFHCCFGVDWFEVHGFVVWF
jgi:hypothetical protein